MAGNELMKNSDGDGGTEVPVEGSAKGTIKAVALFACEECGREFRRRSNLSRHQRLHSGERPFQCPQCRRPFAHRSSLRHHLRLHTGERPYQCSVCLRTFRQRPNYSLHLKTHTGEKHFRCLACGKEFAQRVHLTTHARLHSGELPYACQDCGRRFSQRCHLTRHRGTRGGKAEHLCHLCGRKFLSQSCLTSHLETHKGGTHLQRVQKQCRTQQKKQDKEEGVNGVIGKGVSVARGRVKTKVECEVCHKTFRKTSHLHHHRYTHTGERPYPCPQCGRRFSEAGSLRRHMTSHIRVHLKHTQNRGTPTLTSTEEEAHTPHTLTTLRHHQEIQEERLDTTTDVPGGCGGLHGGGVASRVTTTPQSPPHHHTMTSHHTTENAEVVCREDNAVCTIFNDCLPSGVTVPESNSRFDEHLMLDRTGSTGEAHLNDPLTSQNTAPPHSLIKQTETSEEQTPDLVAPSLLHQASLSQIKTHSHPHTEDMEGKLIKDDRDGMADGTEATETRTNHTSQPPSLPLTPQPLVAVSLFLFGKRVKQEAGVEGDQEESVKEELELIEEAV